MPKTNYLLKFEQCVNTTNKTRFSLSSIRRKLRPYFKTTCTGQMYCFKLKGTDFGFMVVPESKELGNQYYRVVSSKHPNLTFLLCPSDNRDFLEKITFKFNLLSNG